MSLAIMGKLLWVRMKETLLFINHTIFSRIIAIHTSFIAGLPACGLAAACGLWLPLQQLLIDFQHAVRVLAPTALGLQRRSFFLVHTIVQVLRTDTRLHQRLPAIW